MQLTEISLVGFKSFAKPTGLQFKAGLTAIIGPNGSGKSNLAEAVRWVLGEQSAKQLRGTSGTDVIFTGTDKSKQSSKASVSLIFDNEEGRFPVEAPTISVTRSLTRSGQSEYSLNGDPIRLIDLQQLLAEAGIGAKSYAVISQGTVDRYLTATPAKRRELFDEATGIKSLQIKISQADNKLSKVDQHAHEINTIINELEPRLRVLKRQAQKHEERARYTQEYEQKQTLWFHHAWQKSTDKITETEANIKTGKQVAQEMRRNRQTLENELLNNAHRQKSPIDDLKRQLETAEQEFSRLQTSYHANRRQKEVLTNSIEETKNKLTLAEHSLQEARNKANSGNWVDKIKNTLSGCLSLVKDIETKKPLSKTSILQLSSNINDSLKLIKEHATSHSRNSLVTEIEKPLQDVAKLKAILGERERQLKKLPVLSEPSADKTENLRQQIIQQRNDKDVRNLAEAKIRLEEARHKEVSAERDEQAAEMALSQAQTEQAHLKATILREKGTAFLKKAQNQSPPDENPPSENELYQLSQKLSSLGEADPLALREYEEVSARYDHLIQQLEDITDTKNHIEKLKRQLQQEMKIRFHEQLTIIQVAFTDYFKRLFNGGEAQLKLEDEGIEIFVCPPGKRTRGLTLLSGGEKALTSLALLFAILKAQKPPFLVLDEVDAALDEANADRFAEVLKEKSLQTQCIVITHNRQTMSKADVLYGVTMGQNNASNVYSVNLNDRELTENQITA